MLVKAPRKASSAAWILPIEDNVVVAFSVWVLICVCFGAFARPPEIHNRLGIDARSDTADCCTCHHCSPCSVAAGSLADKSIK
jgi:hypothetical protein